MNLNTSQFEWALSIDLTRTFGTKCKVKEEEKIWRRKTFWGKVELIQVCLITSKTDQSVQLSESWSDSDDDDITWKGGKQGTKKRVQLMAISFFLSPTHRLYLLLFSAFYAKWNHSVSDDYDFSLLILITVSIIFFSFTFFLFTQIFFGWTNKTLLFASCISYSRWEFFCLISSSLPLQTFFLLNSSEWQVKEEEEEKKMRWKKEKDEYEKNTKDDKRWGKEWKKRQKMDSSHFIL